LARLTIEKASLIKLCGDSLMLLNRAIEVKTSNIQRFLDYFYNLFFFLFRYLVNALVSNCHLSVTIIVNIINFYYAKYR